MALDPSIALGVRLPQIEGPAQQYQNMLALQSAQKQMQQQDMQMQNMLRQRQEMDETRRILAESGGDFGKASNALLQRGFLDPAVKVQQMADLGQQRTAAAQKSQQEMLALKIKNAREFLPAVQDQDSFSAWRQSTIAEVPQLAQFIPEQYSPETVQRLAVGADEMIKRYPVGNTLMDPTGRVVGSAPAAPVRATGDLALYEAAKAAGYKGDIMQFVREKAAAGRQPQQAPAPSLEKIADPNDPTKTIVINTRQYTPGSGIGSPGVFGYAPPTKTAENIREEEQKTAYNTNRILSSATSISNILKKAPGASQPGGLEASAAAVFGDGGVANLSRSGDRQIVAAAQADIIDSLLYLATGAAYNKEQLAQQRQSYLPAWSDKPETVLAKREALRNLIDGAKIRAGRAWTPKMEDAMNSLVGGKKTDAALSATDQQALDWATANPKDPRSKQIRERLGR